MEKIQLHRNVPLLFIIRICRAMCINLIWTTWPLYVQSLGADVYQVSLVWAFGGAANVLLSIPLSLFSDRFGRKTAIMLSLFFTIFSHFGYTRATSWEQLIPLKMLSNIDWVLYFPAEAAMIADISVSSTRGRVYGIVGAAHPIGSIVAPLLGGIILDSYGWNAVFYSIVLSAIIAFVPSFLLTETGKRTKPNSQENKVKIEVPRKSLKDRMDLTFLFPMLVFAMFNFFTSISQMGLSQVTPIYLKERFNANSFQQGLFFSVGTMVPNLIVQFVGGWLADKYSRRKIIIASVAVSPLLMWLWPSMDSYASLLLLQTLIHFSWLRMPAEQAYIMDFTDDARRGLATGFTQLGMRLGGTVIGAPLIGYLYQEHGQVIPFYAAALLPLPSIPIIMLLKEKKSAKNR